MWGGQSQSLLHSKTAVAGLGRPCALILGRPIASLPKWPRNAISRHDDAVRQSSLVSWCAPPPIIRQLRLKALGFRPTPQLALLSLFFVLSTCEINWECFNWVCRVQAIGAIFSLVIISIPTMNAFRRLAASTDELSKVVSEEVPGTLSSLKLSGLEINELTQQLSNLRQNISGTRYEKKHRSNKPTSFGRTDYPSVN